MDTTGPVNIIGGYKSYRPHDSNGMSENTTTGQKTTISVRKETRERLKKHGRKGMSYDDIVRYVLNEYESLSDARDELQEEING